MVAVRCCFVLIAASLVHAAPRSTSDGLGTLQNSIHETHDATTQHLNPRVSEGSTGGYLADLRYMYKVYQECASSDVTSCLKLKLIAAMDRVARSFNEIPIFEGVTFVKVLKATAVEAEPIKTEAEIEASLPRSLEDKQDALNGLIADKVSSFIGSHTLQIKLPTATDLQRSLTEEGRGKKKKMSGYLLLPLILGGTMIPLALGALALLAGKALIVSKLALVLAGIIGLKKLLSGSGGGHEAGVEVVAGSGGHSGWGRSYTKEEAQKMAYQAYAPKPTS